MSDTCSTRVEIFGKQEVGGQDISKGSKMPPPHPPIVYRTSVLIHLFFILWNVFVTEGSVELVARAYITLICNSYDNHVIGM